MKKNSTIVVVVLMVFFSLGVQAWNLKYGKVFEFSLIAQDGKPFTLQNLKGHVWIADFIYTRCTDECPILSEKMKQLQKKLSPKIDFVSFSVDPTYDSPAVLTQYAKRYGAGPRWFFLTGNPKTISGLAKNTFHLQLSKYSGILVHTNRFVLIDRDGAIRGYYDSESKAELERLGKDVKPLFRQ